MKLIQAICVSYVLLVAHQRVRYDGIQLWQLTKEDFEKIHDENDDLGQFSESNESHLIVSYKIWITEKTTCSWCPETH